MRTYEIKMVCCMCGEHYSTKPGGQTPGQESHGFCGKRCITDYCESIGLDPVNIINKMERRKASGIY